MFTASPWNRDLLTALVMIGISCWSGTTATETLFGGDFPSFQLFLRCLIQLGCSVITILACLSGLFHIYIELAACESWSGNGDDD